MDGGRKLQNLILYDALSITSTVADPYWWVEKLVLSNQHWTEGKSRYYEKRLYSSTISVHYNEKQTAEGPHGTWLEMMGQGCRVFEEFGTGDFESLFQLVLSDSDNFKITRLDVAFDDHSGLVDLDQLLQDTRKQEYISKFRDWDTHEGSKGRSVDHGSQKSDIYLRIYDKAMERGGLDQHWVRVELQLRDERARLFIAEQGQIGEKFCGVLGHYLRYVDPTGDSNRRRWPTKLYWEKLIGEARRIALYVKPGTDYNLAKFDNFVFRQAGNAIWAARQMYGVIGFDEKLENRGTLMNPKYEALVEEFKNSKKVEQYGKNKSKMRSSLGPGGEVHRAIPGGQFLGEAGKPRPGYGGTPGRTGSGLEPAPGADFGQASRNEDDPRPGEKAP